MTDAPLSELARELRDEVSSLREEIKVKAHLAGMDARKAWAEDVVPQLERLERDLEQTRERLSEDADEALHGEAGLRLQLAVAEARDRWRAVEPHLRLLAAQTQELSKETIESIAKAVPDRVKLQAHLAKLDAEDAIQSRRQQVEQLLSDASVGAGKTVRQTLDRLARALEHVRSRPQEPPPTR